MTYRAQDNVIGFDIERLELSSCGHVIYMTCDMSKQRRRDHKTWYCTVCGQARYWPSESDMERIRRERDAAVQREETIRKSLQDTQRRLSAQFGENTKLRNRVKNGVCPCCTRSFQNLKQHIATKHPDFDVAEIQ